MDRSVYAPPLRSEVGYAPREGMSAHARRGTLLLGVAAAVLFALIGVIWSTYADGLREGGREAPPRITASLQPYKAPPADPGGEETPHLDMRVYDVLEQGGVAEGEAAVFDARDAETWEDHVMEDWQVVEPAGAELMEAAADTEDASPENASPENARMADAAHGDAPIHTPRLKPLETARENAPATTVADRAGGVSPTAAPQAGPRTLADAGRVSERLSPTPPAPSAEDLGGASDARAATPAPAVAATPRPLATNEVASSAFFVQVASFRTEASADVGWDEFTARFSDMIEGRQKDVARADLGDRGVRYRLRVNGFSTRESASRFCDRLKARDQECLVVGAS